MNTEKAFIDINLLKENADNPRKISKEQLDKLKHSIKNFPQMLEIRPIVAKKDGTVLGGNMRLKALKELGIDKVHVVYVDNLTDAQVKEFIIKDNLSFGEWDIEELSNWDVMELVEWGLDLEANVVEDKSDELVDSMQKLTEDMLPAGTKIEIKLNDLSFSYEIGENPLTVFSRFINTVPNSKILINGEVYERR